MAKKKTVAKGEEGPAAGGELDCLDTIDAIDGETAFLREMIHLIQAASAGREERQLPCLPNITDDMLGRLARIKEHCERLFIHCSKGKEDHR